LFLPALLMLLAAQVQPHNIQPATVQAVMTAPVLWDTTAPKAGELVKIAIPAETARELLKPGTSWKLLAGAVPVPAMLDGISSGRGRSTASLPFIQTSVKGAADLQVVIDRGSTPQQINEIAFGFKANKVLSKVSFEASPDQVAFEPIGIPQVIYQEQINGKLVKLTNVDVEPQQFRYLRATFSDLGAAELKEALGRFKPIVSPGVEAPLTFGPQMMGANQSDRVWLLKFGEAQDPIVRLELEGQTPTKVLELSIVTLNAQLKPMKTIATAFWVDRLQASGVERSEHSIELPGLDPAQAYGVRIVGDSEAVFTAAKAYTRALAFVFYMPATPDLRLELYPDGRQTAAPAEFNVAQAKSVGVVGQLASRALPSGAKDVAGTAPEALEQWQAVGTRWWRAIAFALGALCLLFIGISLLRRRPAIEP
jgi:hypothetical protein